MVVIWLKNNGLNANASKVVSAISTTLSNAGLALASGTYQASHATDTEFFSSSCKMQSSTDCSKRFGNSCVHGNGVSMWHDVICIVIPETSKSAITQALIETLQGLV